MNEIRVTSPLLPELDELQEFLQEIWRTKWVTNNGHFHSLLEKELTQYLRIPAISLFTNGTLPILTALKALEIKGEVITTPYSFVATAHSIKLSGCKPVFVDIDPMTCNLDAYKIEEAITPKTTAILPVHCYGNPCNVTKIKEIADKHKLKVIYDAAHAFGVEIPTEGKIESILRWGDMSIVSFHATKVFTTLEGGALIVPDEATKKTVDLMRNFGIADETTILTAGINSKMDEVRAAIGLASLRHIDGAIAARKRISERYREQLRDVEGIRVLPEIPGIKYNYGYFPVFIDKKIFGSSRDSVYFQMKEAGFLCRRYFFPLLSDIPVYKELESSAPENLPIARRLSESVLCLPIHHEMSEDDVDRIISRLLRLRRYHHNPPLTI